MILKRLDKQTNTIQLLQDGVFHLEEKLNEALKEQQIQYEKTTEDLRNKIESLNTNINNIQHAIHDNRIHEAKKDQARFTHQPRSYADVVSNIQIDSWTGNIAIGIHHEVSDRLSAILRRSYNWERLLGVSVWRTDRVTHKQTEDRVNLYDSGRALVFGLRCQGRNVRQKT